MAEYAIKTKDNSDINANVKLLVNNTRVFFPSSSVMVFPCARRGQYKIENRPDYYDPEARLNTERTNRLRVATNGFTDSFIESFDEVEHILKFALAGYRFEVANFYPEDVATLLSEQATSVYAHLSIHSGISLNATGYTTDILYRQSVSANDQNSVDVTYDGEDFFVGVSFVNEITEEKPKDGTHTRYNLHIFSKESDVWKPVQTSLLPKVEHGETEDSIKISGDLTIKHGDQTSFKVTEDETILGPTKISELTVTEKTTLNGPFNVELEGDTAFEISADGVTTINTPVRITNATTVVGMTNLSATSIHGLIVGEKAEGDIYDSGIIKAKAGVETPTLKVNTIDSGADKIAIAKSINVQGVASVKNDLIVSEGNINVTKGKVTTQELQVDTHAKIKALDVDTNIDTDTVIATESIATPLIKTNKITSDNTEVIIDKAVNVTGKATLNSDIDVKGNLTVQSGNAILKKTTVEGLTDSGKTNLQSLKVHKTDNTALAEVDKITALSATINTNIDTDTLNATTNISTPIVNVTSTLNVQNENPETPAKANIDEATITNLTINNKAIVKELDAESATIDNLSIGTDINLKNGTITANTITATAIDATTTIDAVTIRQNGKRVPTIDLATVNGKYQLQIKLSDN